MCTLCNTCFLGATRVHNPNSILIGSTILHSSRQSRRARPSMSFPLKIAPSHEESGPPPNKCFLGPIRVHNQDGIYIGSTVFQSSPQSVIKDVRTCPVTGQLADMPTCGLDSTWTIQIVDQSTRGLVNSWILLPTVQQ